MSLQLTGRFRIDKKKNSSWDEELETVTPVYTLTSVAAAVSSGRMLKAFYLYVIQELKIYHEKHKYFFQKFWNPVKLMIW